MKAKISQKFLSGNEMHFVLRYCGYNMTQFAVFIGCSKTHVTTTLHNLPEIPLRYIDDLESYVGTENFDAAMVQVNEYRKRREAERKKRAESASAA